MSRAAPSRRHGAVPREGHRQEPRRDVLGRGGRAAALAAGLLIGCGGGACGGGGRAPAGAPLPTEPAYTGSCDASAAVALGGGRFLVADDEDNRLRVYRDLGPPEQELDAAPFMVLDPRRPEADIEGAAIDGAIIYWVSSHGRSAKGRPRPSRLQFFATRLADDGTTVRLEAYGKPYTRLLDALVALGFGEDINLEGLAVTHQGNVLLGFRSPTPGGKALVVPLSNPADLVQGAEPRFGEPLLLDLGGLGIRSLERFGDGYLVAAGPASDERRGRLFRWDGAATVTPVDVELGDFMPEALVVRDRSVLMLSDDGALRVGDKECKRSSAKRFRGRTVELP